MSKRMILSSDFEEVDVMGLDNSNEFDVIIEFRNPNDPSPMPKSSLINIIQEELSTVKKQLDSINEKIAKNREIINKKQSQNEGMKILIDKYYGIFEEEFGKTPSCGWKNACIIA